MGWHSPNILSNHLAANERHLPEFECAVQGSRRITWSELSPRARRLAASMIRLGVRKGDRVALLLPSGIPFIEVNYGLQIAGAIPVPLNYRFTVEEIARSIVHSRPRAIVFDPVFEADLSRALDSLEPRAGPSTFVSTAPSSALPGAVLLEELLSSGEDRDPRVATGSEDVAVLLYTGGTTGAPKGVLLTYGALLEMFANLLVSLGLRGTLLDLSEDQLARLFEGLPVPSLLGAAPRVATLLRASPLLHRLLDHSFAEKTLRALVRRLLDHPELPRLTPRRPSRFFLPSMPFFHIASYQILHLSALVGWVSLLISETPRFDAAETLALVERERPFLLANVPTAWRRLLEHPDLGTRDLRSLRVAATGASACPVDLKREILVRMPGILLLDLLGQTEMTPITSFRFDVRPDRLKERSVGRAIVDVRIVDDSGKEVPKGTVGEICYRSSSMMKGYFEDDRATSEILRDGWLRSGDLGYLDPEGEVRILERRRECINTGGEKVFPGEVEETLRRHPSVEEVCVLGVLDVEWGESVRAVVQARVGWVPTEDDLVDHCRRSLAGYKVPRSVIFVDRIPASETGKVLRGEVRTRHGHRGA